MECKSTVPNLLLTHRALDSIPKWLKFIVKAGVVAEHLSRLPTDSLTGGYPDEHLESHLVWLYTPAAAAGSAQMQYVRVVKLGSAL